MILLSNIKIKGLPEEQDLKKTAAKALRISENDIACVKLARKSVDARNKADVHFNCKLFVECKNEYALVKKNKNAAFYSEEEFIFPEGKTCSVRPVVVGFGPAGMFAALTLARAGLRPIVLERGEDADTRLKSVTEYWKGGVLNKNSNVQFGEGGAGTFSDGKLATGIKDSLCKTVLKEFAAHGAKQNILYDAKPHIGTDILISVVKNIRGEITALGGEVHFGAKMTEICLENNAVNAVKYEENGNEITLGAEHIILAVGHSARDTFEHLKALGVELVRKPFSMGVRIEHKQTDINKSQYGESAKFSYLPAADYKLAVHPDGRGVYTFCMCPGGVVVSSASEENTYVTNGMSYNARDKENANSAVLVSVLPEDIEGDDVLAGIYLQRSIELKAFELTNGQGLPAQTVGDFLNNKVSADFGSVKPSVKPGAVPTDLNALYPPFITNALKQALPLMGKKLNGFDSPDAVLTAPETRSSCPVRIVRNEKMQSSVSGLIPAGEGAGYAGGITSAAVDGIRAALSVIENI